MTKSARFCYDQLFLFLSLQEQNCTIVGTAIKSFSVSAGDFCGCRKRDRTISMNKEKLDIEHERK